VSDHSLPRRLEERLVWLRLEYSGLDYRIWVLTELVCAEPRPSSCGRIFQICEDGRPVFRRGTSWPFYRPWRYSGDFRGMRHRHYRALQFDPEPVRNRRRLCRCGRRPLVHRPDPASSGLDHASSTDTASAEAAPASSLGQANDGGIVGLARGLRSSRGRSSRGRSSRGRWRAGRLGDTSAHGRRHNIVDRVDRGLADQDKTPGAKVSKWARPTRWTRFSRS